MEEVDEIVLHTLRQVGCDLTEISSLREFTTEAAIEGVVRCLKLINPSLELSHHVPPNMSARYRLGSTLASICTELGFKGEIGYQTFLYSNESDLRKVFLFLVEKLPKESEKALDEPLNVAALIVKEAGSSLANSLNSPWLPHYCKNHVQSDGKYLLKNQLYSLKSFQATPLFRPYNYSHIKDKKSVENHCETFLHLEPQQVHHSKLLASVLEANTADYVKQLASEGDQDDLTNVLNRKEIAAQRKEKISKIINEHLLQALQLSKSITDTLGESSNEDALDTRSSRFKHSLELQFTPEKKANVSAITVAATKPGDTAEDMQKKREVEIKELQEKLDVLGNKLEELILENKNYNVTSQSFQEQINKEEENINDIKEHYRVKKCTLSLLPDAESNIEKLQGLIDTSTQRLVSLATQWEKHRVPLIEQYRELKELSSKRVSETQRKLEEIKSLREKIKNLGVEARQKEEMHKHLVTAYDKLTKDVSRSAYTRRIMEIVGNIKKQKYEIDKVLLDTRNVQKEINKLSGKLERTFTVTDELVFKDAKKDEAIRRVYKFLAALHENCSQLVVVVEETGAIVREIRELEDQIDQENQKKVAATLERIASDYKQMQQENALLLGQFKTSS